MEGGLNQNSDGGSAWGKLPLAGNDQNTLSAVGSLANSKNGNFQSASSGLVLDNVKGHSLSATGTHITGFGNQASVAGKVNLMNSNGHDLSANAFATKTFPNNPAIPNFNTVGGGMDYSFNNKAGASVGVQHMDLLKKTDYSAMGNLNIHKTPTSSFDVSAGVSKSVSPFMPNSSWQKSGRTVYGRRAMSFQRLHCTEE